MKPSLSQESFAESLSVSEKLKIILCWSASTISADHDSALFSYLADCVYYWGLICWLTLFCAVCLDLTADWLTIGPGGSLLGSQVSRALAKASSGHNEFPMHQLQPNLSCMQ